MREILFRGKRIDNGKWVEGFYVTNPEWDRRISGEHHWIVSLKNALRYEVDPSTVGQYTGLIDKNGKKIFEGDIVWCFNVFDTLQLIGMVRWDDTFVGWHVSDSAMYHAPIHRYNVIGNVYDAEILEEAQCDGKV